MPTLAGDVQAVLADEKVVFQGQEVAFVVAEDRYIAADAVDLVEVEYEELPALVDPTKSMAADARTRLARRPQGQDKRRPWAAQTPQPRLHLGGRRRRGHGAGPERGAGHGQGTHRLFSASTRVRSKPVAASP
jgi:xanthine dehydrogenase molybdopterin-binding subunit B